MEILISIYNKILISVNGTYQTWCYRMPYRPQVSSLLDCAIKGFQGVLFVSPPPTITLDADTCGLVNLAASNK